MAVQIVITTLIFAQENLLQAITNMQKQLLVTILYILINYIDLAMNQTQSSGLLGNKLTGPFTLFAGDAIINNGSTVVTGNIMTDPGRRIRGFPPGNIIDGNSYVNDESTLQARLAIIAVYSIIENLQCNKIMTNSNSSYTVITPGVYCFIGDTLDGILLLDAGGNANVTFVFKFVVTLQIAANSVVKMVNGGNNCSVYWHFAESVTVGTGVALIGNVIAAHNITLEENVTLAGRALSVVGIVAMNNNTISTTSCYN